MEGDTHRLFLGRLDILLERSLILEEAALPQHGLCLSSCAKLFYYVRNMKIYGERLWGTSYPCEIFARYHVARKDA